MPYFPENVENVTVQIGLSAELRCKVENLNNYKVVYRLFVLSRFTWYHVIFQTGPRDGVGTHVLQYNNKNALSNFGH